ASARRSRAGSRPPGCRWGSSPGRRRASTRRARAAARACPGAPGAARAPAPGVTGAGATADAGQDDQLTAALDALTGRLGVPEALVYNAGLIRRDRPGELSREQHSAPTG